jgi:hypothetical protein
MGTGYTNGGGLVSLELHVSRLSNTELVLCNWLLTSPIFMEEYIGA